MKISTIAVHGGLTDTSHYAAAFPVYLTSTFIQKGPTEFREYGYSRTANPTRSDVEKHAADIEGAKHGIATATGSSTSKRPLIRSSKSPILLMWPKLPKPAAGFSP